MFKTLFRFAPRLLLFIPRKSVTFPRQSNRVSFIRKAAVKFLPLQFWRIPRWISIPPLQVFHPKPFVTLEYDLTLRGSLTDYANGQYELLRLIDAYHKKNWVDYQIHDNKISVQVPPNLVDTFQRTLLPSVEKTVGIPILSTLIYLESITPTTGTAMDRPFSIFK
jgi:hypothetical protein